jgi:hypothetical protein
MLDRKDRPTTKSGQQTLEDISVPLTWNVEGEASRAWLA